MNLWKNSKYVKSGDVFLVDSNNKEYVKDAIKNGCKKIITELNDTYKVKTIKVNSVDDYIKSYYDFTDITLIGITGTNGKTTTCFLIYQMLRLLNIKSAYIGTIGFYIDKKIIDLNNTTPSIDELYYLINKAKKKKCKVVVMEVSSHALKQDRVHGLLFDAVGVTNVTKEHLDYHKSMKDYVNSKRKLIFNTKNKKICVLNRKDKYYKCFINNKNSNYIIGKDIKIKKVIMNMDGINLEFYDNKKIKVNLNLIGEFNVYNFLMAYKIIKELGYDYKNVLKSSYKLKEPSGRLDKIIFKNNTIFIDYAHTPDAVEKVLRMMNKIKNNGIITIIGCGGERDKEKRPVMANIACKHSKYVIFTNDNPRSEDEKLIISDMLKGAKSNYEVIYDRYKAIKKGVGMLDNKMILMILGKGHEEYQIIGNKKTYFSDIKTVLKVIDKRLY